MIGGVVSLGSGKLVILLSLSFSGVKMGGSVGTTASGGGNVGLLNGSGSSSVMRDEPISPFWYASIPTMIAPQITKSAYPAANKSAGPGSGLSTIATPPAVTNLGVAYWLATITASVTCKTVSSTFLPAAQKDLTIVAEFTFARAV